MSNSDQYKALSEPMRLKIMEFLKNGPMTVNELAKECKSTKSNISQHLKFLKNSGFIEGRKEGVYVFYSLKNDISAATNLINQVSGTTLNTIVMEEKFLNMVKALYNLQQQMIAKEKTMEAYERFVLAVQAYMQKAFHYGLPHPKTKGEYFEFLTKNIAEFKIPSLLRWSGGNDFPVLMKETGTIHSFWISFLEESVEYDSQESKNIEDIFNAINALNGEEKESLMNDFIKVRHVISDPRNPSFLSSFDKKQLLKPFSREKYKHIYPKMNFLFEELRSKKVYVCPHCGGILKQTKKDDFTCVHWRCKQSIVKKLEKKELHTTKLDHQQYFVFTDWVQRYIRIPGIEEYRIGEETTRILNKEKNNNHKVEMNPDGDRIDILIEDEKGFPVIQGDVKDYEFPYNLAQHLNEYNENKVGELEKIYIIVPRDTIIHSPLNYIQTVKNLVKANKGFLEVVSESQWYDKVRKINNKGGGA